MSTVPLAPRPRRHGAWVTVAAVLLASCGEPTGPGLRQSDFVGTYRLTRLQGQTLPTPVPGSAIVYYANVYELRADSTYRETVIRSRYDEARRDTVFGSGRWAFRPGSLRGQDAVWLDPGFGGTARGTELPYKVRDRGRELYSDEFLDGTPRAPWVYVRQ